MADLDFYVSSVSLHELTENTWKNFKFKTGRELSDFEAWAMRELWAKSVGNDIASYYIDGALIGDLDETSHVHLCLTDNGVPHFKVYELDEQVAQYVISDFD